MKRLRTLLTLVVILVIMLTSFSQVYATDGTTPKPLPWQTQNKPLVDMMLIVAHPDDDQLWLGAVGPTYTNQGKRVVTVCITYNSTKRRGIEMINGRRLVKDKYAPVFGNFPDLYVHEPELKRSWTEAKMQTFLVEQIRKYKPAVVVTQDIKGEYGHPSHIWTVKQVQKAVVNSGNKTLYWSSFYKYGTWNPLKTYLHLYPYNKMVLNVDQPLSLFGGKTAFQMAQLGFKCHISQDRGRWQVSKVTNPSRRLYSCRDFGLYRSLVGYTNKTNNMFENVTMDAIYRANPWIKPTPKPTPTPTRTPIPTPRPTVIPSPTATATPAK